MEFSQVVRRRKMCRSFTTDPIPRDQLEDLLALSLRVPSAGHTQGRHLLVLHGNSQVRRYFAAALPHAAEFPWPGLLNAAALVVFCANRDAYLDRYAEADKTFTDRSPDHWSVPMWHVDTAFAAMTLLLAAVDAGLGALFFGVFPPQLAALREQFAIPDELHPIGTIALGTPAADDRPSRSTERGWKSFAEQTTWGGWAK